jgi:hypothetical protein
LAAAVFVDGKVWTLSADGRKNITKA